MPSSNKSNISKASNEWSLVGGIRNQYQLSGDATTYYETFGEEYRNPHFQVLKEVLPRTLFHDIVVPKILVPILKTKRKQQSDDAAATMATTTTFRVLDFCCGAGEFTKILLHWSKDVDKIAFAITGADPYTRGAFVKETEGLECRPWSFKDVCEGCLEEEGDEDFVYDFVAISYAIHLLDASLEYVFYNALAKRCRYLVIVSPTKNKGAIEKRNESSFGFKEIAYDTKLKVHLRVFESLRV
jgi:SAM-dependent methyltransferase